VRRFLKLLAQATDVEGELTVMLWQGTSDVDVLRIRAMRRCYSASFVCFNTRLASSTFCYFLIVSLSYDLKFIYNELVVCENMNGKDHGYVYL
jgi:hypothetical protein